MAKVCAVHLVLVNYLGGLSLPRNSVVRLTDHPVLTIVIYCDLTIAVYCGLEQ